jgi:hypothetical protein
MVPCKIADVSVIVTASIIKAKPMPLLILHAGNSASDNGKLNRKLAYKEPMSFQMG